MRFKQDRAFYRPNPEFNQNIRLLQFDDIPGSELYTYENRNGKPAAIAFAGRRQKPDWNYQFINDNQRQTRIDNWLKEQRAHAEYKAKQRAKRTSGTTLIVGDILVGSWGYDQTNVNFYQVVARKGKCMVQVRPIAHKLADNVEQRPPCDYVVPMPDTFKDWDVLLSSAKNEKGDIAWKRATGDSISLDHCSASKWNGQPKYETTSGWGH